MTNYELRIMSVWHALKLFSFLCVLSVLTTTNSFAQDNLSSKKLDDFLSKKLEFEQALRFGSIEQKRNALSQIRNLQAVEASRIAIPALTDDSEIVRATAAFSVIFLPKEEASGALLPLLNDKKELVRREAAYALGKVGNTGSVTPLVRILQTDKILEVRAASAIALGEIGDAAAVSELVKVLQRKLIAKEEFVRRSAARSIGQIAQKIQINKRKVITPENFLPDKYNPIEKPQHPKLFDTFPVFRDAADVLIRALQNRKEFDDVKREAAFALGAIGDASAIPVLQANLNAKDYYLAKICADALKKIDSYQSVLEN